VFRHFFYSGNNGGISYDYWFVETKKDLEDGEQWGVLESAGKSLAWTA
jgi:hypothetical protein